MGADEIHRMLDNAEINHCLSFEQVGEEIVEQYKIPEGDFDTVAKCEYTVPGYLEIGRVYQQLVLSIGAKQRPEDAIYSVLYLSSVMQFRILIQMCIIAIQTICAVPSLKGNCSPETGRQTICAIWKSVFIVGAAHAEPPFFFCKKGLAVLCKAFRLKI